MGAMSDLHILGTRVLDGESPERVAEDTVGYSKDDIEWASREIEKSRNP